jgi:hypothetical protein
MSNAVRKRSAKIEAMAECWPMITALLGGTGSMRKAGKTYLPQWPNENSGFYDARLATATLFPAFARTIDVLCGKPFSHPLTYGKDTPPKIIEYCEDIDLQGRNMHSFAASVTEEAMAYGICGILVDCPETGGLRTAAEEKAAGVRPYFVQISAESLLDYDSERIGGIETFTLLRFMESVAEKIDDFEEEVVEQVRVLYPGRWATYREKKNETTGEIDWVVHKQGVTSLQKIPFVPVYGKRIGFMQAMPPMRELAFMNIEHWQSKSDQQTILHVARVPVLFARGFGEDAKLIIGAAAAVASDRADADLKYVEHSGKAIDAGRLSILDIEDRMRQVGAELLVIKPGKITVAQTLSDNEPGMCALQRITQDVEDSLDQAMQLMAEYIGEKDGGHLSIYSDFGAASLAEASAELLIEMNVAGTLSNETLFDEIKRRGMLRDDLTWTAEQIRIKSQPAKQGVTLPGM